MEEGCIAKVRQDFFTTNEGELSLRKGELFQVHKVVDKYWCYGCSKGKFGQFPSNNLLATNIPPLSQNEELFVALEDFAAQEEGDLSFRKGDFIVGEEKMDEHWWRGYVQKGRTGMFPDNYTWQVDTALLKKGGTEQVNLQARVKMSLTAQLDEEMDLRAGEIVTITEKIDKDWYRGVCGDRSGIFPSSCVTLLDDAPPNYCDVFSKPPSNAQADLCKNTFSETDFGRTNRNNSTDLLTFSPEREIKPAQATSMFDSYSSESNRSSITSAQQDLLTFSPERETAPARETDVCDDIFNDDYFRVNMPLAFGSFDRRSSEPNYDTSAVGSCIDVEENTSSVPPYGVTLYPFYAQFNNELSFHENEFVHLIRYVDNDWMEGELDGRKGIFPVNYINILVDCARPDADYISSDLEHFSSENLPFLPPHSLAKVKYNFDAQMNGDLCVKEGDIVMIVNAVNEDWYTVKNRLGAVGLCPANHLEMHMGSDTTLFRSSSFSTGDGSSFEITPTQEQNPVPCFMSRTDPDKETNEVEAVQEKTCESLGEVSKEELPRPAKVAPARPPPAKRKPPVADKGPHRPAPPAPLPGKSPVHRSIRRLPRQTSAPSDIKCGSAMPVEALEEKRKKLSEQRQNVISELVITEKEYVRDLKMMYEVFNLYNPQILESKGADVKVLFGNLLEVIQISEEMLDSFQWSMKNKDESEQMIGPSFTKHADTVKSVYTEYCTNHENALALLTKYEAIPAIQNVFEKGLETLRYQVTCFNMDSLLIKPVQRVLKYPLILNELIKSTEDDHPDKAELLKAIKTYTDMASDINECKRRKDIVSKYLVNGSDTLARRMGRLSLHSVAKKSSRIGARISSSLGLSSAPKDEKFVLQEKRFRSLEKTIRTLVKNVEVLMNHIHSEVKILFDIGEELVQYYGDQSKAVEVEGFRSAQRNIADAIWHGFKNTVNRRVIEPLTNLLELFNGPSLLIEKRNDKLLDYDNVLARSEKSQDRRLIGELQIARSNYEALNQQLVEELPHFIDLSSDILGQCIGALIGARKLLSGNITKRYMGLLEETGLSASGGNLIEAFEVKHLLICKQLARSSFATKPMKSEAESSGGSSTRESNKTPSPVVQKMGGLSSGQLQGTQPESQCAYLRSKYTPDKLFKLKENHGSVDVYDLAISRGHLVGVIKRQDPMGNTSRWFVDDGNMKGFVRCNCLEPVESLTPSTGTNLGYQSERQISPVSSGSPSPARSSYVPGDRRFSNPRSPSTYMNIQEIQSNDLSPGNSSLDSRESRNEYDLPPDYEEVTASNPAEPAEPAVPAFFYAMYDFSAQTQDALSVRTGQVVNVLRKEDLEGNREWWWVENRHGVQGYVPANYLHPYVSD